MPVGVFGSYGWSGEADRPAGSEIARRRLRFAFEGDHRVKFSPDGATLQRPGGNRPRPWGGNNAGAAAPQANGSPPVGLSQAFSQHRVLGPWARDCRLALRAQPPAAARKGEGRCGSAMVVAG